MSFENRVALITGASRGIGRACAEVLAEAGAKTVIAARSAEALARAAAELGARGLAVFPIQLDVADHARVKTAVAEILARFGKIDILVNNAGIVRDNLVVRMKKEEWDEVLAVNLTGTFHCTREVLPSMIRQRYGRIINVASVVGLMGNPGQANYVASKAAIIGFTKAVAREVASRNITVNAVAPGFIETEMTLGIGGAAREQLLERIPLGRIGSQKEVAWAVKFLASDEASYITGEVLNVNGGMYM